MAQQQALEQPLVQWGRFTLVSKELPNESDHLYFCKNEHRIGRNRVRSDLILDKLWISSVHCVVTLEDAGDDAAADERFTIQILDLSRNAVYVNEERVGKSNTAVLKANDTIHFTKPGLNTRTISPTVYKFEIFADGFSEANTRLRNAQEALESTPNTQPVTTPAAPAASAATPATSATADACSTQGMAHASPSVTIAPTQNMGSAQKNRKRSVDKTHEDMDVDFTATGHLSSAARAPSVSSASGSGSGSSSKRLRREAKASGTPSDAIDAETTARIQQSNRDLRRRLEESKGRELALSKNLSEAEIEILSVTSKLEECHEHGKKLQDELNRKDDEADERERLIAQLKQEKLKQDVDLAASAQALIAANDMVKLRDAAIEDFEREKTKLETNLATVTAQLNSIMSKNATLGAQVNELEKKTRKLENAKLSVSNRREVVEENKREVQEEKDMIGNTLNDAMQVFAEIHKQLLRGEKLASRPIVAEFLASCRRRRRQSEEEDSASTEHSSSLGDLRNFTDSSLFLSEQSQPTPVSSSDLNNTQQEPDEAETLDQDAALASAPLPPLDPVLAGARQALQLKRRRSSQDADDEDSDARKKPSVAADGGDGDDDEHDTPDQQRGDSEESAISVHSASKTPPAKPLRATATPVHSQQEEKEVAKQIVVVAPDVVEVVVVEDEAAEPEQEEEEEVAGDEEDKVTAAKEPATDAKVGKEEDDDEEEEDDDFVILDAAPAPVSTKTNEDQDDSSDDRKKKKQNDDECDVTAAADQKQEVNEDDKDDEDGDSDDEDEPPVLTRSAPEQQQRWLPMISHDESLDSQANASESAGIFDDEIQLSQ